MPGTTWKVINATSKKKLVVINASVNSDAPEAFYYDQTTTLLPFSNGDLVGHGNSDSIVIPAVRTDAGGHSLPFTFIVAEAETLAPVKAVTFRADLSDLSDLTIDDATVSDMATVFGFLKNITSFPASELATTFAALDYTNANAVKEFFDSSDDYSVVTLDALSLVRSYYNALPYGWANGKDVTIYLYGGTYEDVSDTDKVMSIGTLKISNDWTAPLPLTAPASFKMELKLNDDKERALVFSDGVFRDTNKTSTAKLSLAGSFAVPSQLALSDNDDNLRTLLVGKVNGMSAFGLEGIQPHDSNEDGNSFLELFDVRSFRDGLTLAMYGVGIAAGIFILVKVGQFFKWVKDHGNPTVDQKERIAQTEQLKQHVTEKAQAIIDEVNDLINVPPQEELHPDQAAYTIHQLASKTKQSMRNVQKMVDAQRAQIDILASKFAGEELQIIVDRLEAVEAKLDGEVTPESLARFRTELPEIVDQLRVNNTTIFIAKTKALSHLTREEREGYDRAYESYDRIRITQEKMNEHLKDIEEGLDEREFFEEEGARVIE